MMLARICAALLAVVQSSARPPCAAFQGTRRSGNGDGTSGGRRAAARGRQREGDGEVGHL
jgi:hypothetical protein